MGGRLTVGVMKHPLMIALAGLGLAACMTTTSPGEPPVPPAAEDSCGARQYVGLVGKPVSSRGVPAAGPRVRHIWPNTIVTMDLQPTRLNVMIREDGTIEAFRCY